jgi:hypothetical protein
MASKMLICITLKQIEPRVIMGNKFDRSIRLDCKNYFMKVFGFREDWKEEEGEGLKLISE